MHPTRSSASSSSSDGARFFRARRIAVAALWSVTAAACSAPQRGATGSQLAQAQSSAPDGSLVFDSYCAECHGSRGSGTTQHPAIIGESALIRYANALELHEYMAAHMPKVGKEELSPPDYWAVLSFIVVANGARLPDEGLNESNAANVKLRDH